jgi:hypothetical protein
MTQAGLPRGGDQVRWASGVNVLAGLWMIISPFVLGYSNLSGALWSDVIVGIAIAVVAAIRAGGAVDQPWLSWVNALLGAWLIVSPWVLGFADSANALWNNVIIGVIVLVLGAWSGFASRSGTGTGSASLR